MAREHEAVMHSAGEYVRDDVHTNGMESFWSLLKRGYIGTFHHYITARNTPNATLPSSPGVTTGASWIPWIKWDPPPNTWSGDGSATMI